MKALILSEISGPGAYGFDRTIKVLKGERQNYIEETGYEWQRDQGRNVTRRHKVTPEQAITVIRIIEDGLNPYPDLPHSPLNTAADYLHREILQHS
jgi:hypothetical protein